ncbi:GrpB family protein [Okeania sp. SIO3I5]|uniref:GrpB family protein n=1 Tax=Okeania sp. SIO3I5 TaxID=2607805 RepID=UPI0025E44119|nr:GrpB family protein [Okeania sp. SIO3I5]
MKIMRKVEVVNHNQKWREKFQIEAQKINPILGENIIAIHHIGSTAIADIYAKPIIDILVEVKNLVKVDERNSLMESLDYEVMGEFGIAERRYFRKNNQEGIRTYHVHIFEVNSKQVERHLAFRDYMISHPEDAHKYSELKGSLAQKYPTDIDSYMNGKDSFIKEIDRKATQWRLSIQQSPCETISNRENH